MSFIPRTTFPVLPSLPRSYFLGHHKAGLAKMKSLLGSIDLVLECRDYRVPLTSRNPLFEKTLEGKERVVVYTKRDLGGGGERGGGNRNLERIVTEWHKPHKVVFTSIDPEKRGMGGGGIEGLLQFLREHASERWKLVGHRLMVAGMPNVGKSTLLNALRNRGTGKGKAASTGSTPGVTRKIGTGVKIIPGEDDNEKEGVDRVVKCEKYKGVGGGVYLLDTPGVFIPYVPEANAMLKLALVGAVKDTIISPVLLADYLLFHLNRVDPSLYHEYSRPTNEIMELLDGVAERTGRLGKKGKFDTEAASLWLVQRWRQGGLGRFVLDEVTEGALEEVKGVEEMGGVVSFSQAKKVERERRRERGRARGKAKIGVGG